MRGTEPEQQHALCPRCGKRRYPSRAAARRAGRRISPGRRMHSYRCEGFLHLTSWGAVAVANWRDWVFTRATKRNKPPATQGES